ncbi:YIP1 family protein [Paracoccus thiocyanatus]|uniref:YIP1 family protein n=1 Tax=Paracoccus thiocyanatus TaxID=34006 RepID=A0A1N6N5W2_9RHOB|nr:YIP1 family protein [Paracoccus thiocyanatus]RDW13503.1 YIP1 family protein [Paracoccus thiocyanatus]SIP87411.1 Yip1 domain-containing protein [Paracoccus thiocyanatus]
MKAGDLGEMMVLTLRDPDRALDVLRGLDLPMAARWMVLLLAVTLSTLLAGLSLLLFPIEVDNPVSRMLSEPLTLAGIQFGAMVMSALFVAQIGRLFGGQGDFPDALLAIGWVELMLVGLQAVQVVMMVVFPATATLLSMVAFGLFLYLAVTMTKALHGFTSTPKVVLGLIGSLFLLGFVLSLIAAAFGIVPEVAP